MLRKSALLIVLVFAASLSLDEVVLDCIDDDVVPVPAAEDELCGRWTDRGTNDSCVLALPWLHAANTIWNIYQSLWCKVASPTTTTTTTTTTVTTTFQFFFVTGQFFKGYSMLSRVYRSSTEQPSGIAGVRYICPMPFLSPTDSVKAMKWWLHWYFKDKNLFNRHLKLYIVLIGSHQCNWKLQERQPKPTWCNLNETPMQNCTCSSHQSVNATADLLE